MSITIPSPSFSRQCSARRSSRYTQNFDKTRWYPGGFYHGPFPTPLHVLGLSNPNIFFQSLKKSRRFYDLIQIRPILKISERDTSAIGY